MNENLKKTRFRSFISILFVGFLGSGLWDFAFRDVSLVLGNFFANSMSIFYHDYLENLYKGAGDNGELLNIFPSIIFILTIALLPAIYLFYFTNFFRWSRIRSLSKIDYAEYEANNSKKTYNRILSFLLEKKIRFYLIILAFTIPLSILYLNLLVTESTKISAYKSVERDLEVIRPYVIEYEYYLLRSRFRLMNSRSDVKEIYLKIDSIGECNNITLPERFLIGIN